MSKKKKNLKVKILIGLPASGKSTWSREFIKKQTDEDWVKIGRDDFRYMLKDQGSCEPKIESLINKLQDDAILSALNSNCNVIIDNTNVKAKYINHFIELVQYKADVEFMLFDVSSAKCIERDKLRDDPKRIVGKDDILNKDKNLQILKESYPLQNQSKKPYVYKHPIINYDLPNCYIFDIDGTLAHMQNKRGPYDWNKVDLDEIDESVQNLYFSLYNDLLGSNCKIFIVSGRDESCRYLTESWLREHQISYENLYMRPENDYRKDNIVKEEIYNNHFKDKYNILGVFDDRDQVVNMWRSLGIKCFQVEPGNF